MTGGGSRYASTPARWIPAKFIIILCCQAGQREEALIERNPMKSSHSSVLAVCLFALALTVNAIQIDNSEIVSSSHIASFNDIQIGMTPDNIETMGFNDEFRFFSNMRMFARGYRTRLFSFTGGTLQDSFELVRSNSSHIYQKKLTQPV